jgi:capsular exopolysaccharide synthesis family protein
MLIRKLENKGRSDNGNHNKLSLNIISYHDPKSPASEAYRELRTNIGYLSVDKQLKTILFTSAGPAEGKSTTAANFAVSMAQIEKNVLLMEGDLRKPKVHRYFSVLNDIGLTDAIVNKNEVNDIVKNIDEIENLHLICSGPIPPNPSEIMESKKWLICLSR